MGSGTLPIPAEIQTEPPPVRHHPSILVSPQTEMAWPDTVLERGLAVNTTMSASCCGVTYSLIDVAAKASFSISSYEMRRASALAVSGAGWPAEAEATTAAQERNEALFKRLGALLADVPHTRPISFSSPAPAAATAPLCKSRR